MRYLCVFCGSRPGARASYRQAAERLGSLLGQRGLGLVYGGGHVGLMGAVADAALAAGAPVIGVIPGTLVERELAHTGLTSLEVVDSMHARKARMAELSEAFLALPGGWGTCEELFEVLTWNQLGLHSKPCGVLEVGGFFAPLLRFLEHAREEGFVTPGQHARLHCGDDAAQLLTQLGM